MTSLSDLIEMAHQQPENLEEACRTHEYTVISQLVSSLQGSLDQTPESPYVNFQIRALSPRVQDIITSYPAPIQEHLHSLIRNYDGVHRPSSRPFYRVLRYFALPLICSLGPITMLYFSDPYAQTGL